MQPLDCINQQARERDLISRLSDLRSQYNLFDEAEQGAYHTLTEAIAVLNGVNESGNQVKDLISRQQTVNALCDNCDHMQAVCPHYPCKQYTKIEQLPSAHPTQPNTPNTLKALDCISRKDAVDIINGYAEQFNGYIGTPNDSEVYAYARGLLLSIERNISALPSAQSEIVRCEECEHKMECYGDVIMKTRGFGIVYCPLEYCSEGKRKDG